MGLVSLDSILRTGAAAAVAVALACPGTVLAADWKPEKRVEIVLGSDAGGDGMNRTAHLIREWFVRDGLIPSTSIVLNKPGGGHAVALAYTASKAGTAETIQIVNTPLITNNLLGRSPITYKDFTPLALLYDENVLFTVAEDSKIKNAQDLLDRLKKDPESIVFSTATGLGTVQHIATIALAKSAGVDLSKVKLKTVNFSGQGEAITAALGGRVDVVVSSPPSQLPFIEAKKLRPIALASEKRAGGLLADVPTWKELGIDSVIYAWRGVVGPKDMTPEQLAFWDKSLGDLTKSEEWKNEVGKEALNFRYLDSAGARAFFASETQRYAKIYRELGIDVSSGN